MKKLKVLSLIFACCFLLVGCGDNQVLSCTINQEQNGLNMDQTVDVTFSGNQVTNVKMTVDSEATDDTIKNNWDAFAKMLDEQYPDSNKNGIKVTKENSKDDFTYKISIDVDFKKASDDDLADYNLSGLADAEGTYDSVKKQAEKSGFTCK